ncbi:MAG TPA: GDP-mannose 4,6-dehydratase [Candidatus Eisenbacteria bacterium]|nr:GDP-mannose 4,6-dehydratase [Candidatus Eisenbacteria bacterium]
MGTSRILITGANGFVGRHLARRIAEGGDTALGLGIDQAPEDPTPLAAWWTADLVDEAGLRLALSEARPDAIVHLAAQSSGALSLERPVDTYRVNALGTLSLLAAVRATAKEARVLVIGTGEVYGALADGTRVAEDAPLHPVSPYGLSKAAADVIAESCAPMWDLDVVRVRAFGHFGPGQREHFFVPSVARQIAEIESSGGEPVLRVGNLDVTRDLTDVRDVVEAYLALLERGRSGAAYNVCRGQGIRLADLVAALGERARRPIRIEVDPARVRPADLRYLVGDPSAILRDTGWKATIPLAKTLDEVLEEWRGRATGVAPHDR